MSPKSEFVEWHLTEHGWVRGTEHTTFGGTLHIDPPSGRVLTYRWVSEPVSGRSYTLDRLEEQWRSSDEESIRRLLARYGDVRRLNGARSAVR